MKKFFNFVIIITTLISIVTCLYVALDTNKVESGYELIWLQPLVFAMVYLLILRPIIKMNKFKITVFSVIILAWLRFILIPFFSVVSDVYNGIQYLIVSPESTQLAILISVYELFISSLFLYILSNLDFSQTGAKLSSPPLELTGKKSIYALFIALAFILYLSVGRKLYIIDLFVISADTTGSNIESTSFVLLSQIFKCGMVFFFVWFTSYCQQRHEKTGNIAYVYYPIIVAIVNVGIIVGERRTEQVYTAFAVMFILTAAFKQHSRKIIISISAAAGTILLFMSIYKHFGAYYYGSYANALQASTINLEEITKILQSYFFGTQNIASAIEFKQVADLNLLNMIYDFGRSTFGFSFLLKGRMFMTTEYFNTYIYGFSKANGHVISGVGYGYMYLGALLSPLIACLNIFFAVQLEKWFYRTTSYELKYIVGYMLARFVTNVYVNTPPLISLSTNMLFTAGLIYFVARIFNTRTPLAVKIKSQPLTHIT